MTTVAVKPPRTAEESFLAAADAYVSRFGDQPANMLSPSLREFVESWRAWKGGVGQGDVGVE